MKLSANVFSPVNNLCCIINKNDSLWAGNMNEKGCR